jgi:hypothetical protein
LHVVMFDEYLDFLKNKSWQGRNIKNREAKQKEREEKG